MFFSAGRYACPLSAGLRHALLCLKVYSWCIRGEGCAPPPPPPPPSCSLWVILVHVKVRCPALAGSCFFCHHLLNSTHTKQGSVVCVLNLPIWHNYVNIELHLHKQSWFCENVRNIFKDNKAEYQIAFWMRFEINWKNGGGWNLWNSRLIVQTSCFIISFKLLCQLKKITKSVHSVPWVLDVVHARRIT